MVNADFPSFDRVIRVTMLYKNLGGCRPPPTISIFFIMDAAFM